MTQTYLEAVNLRKSFFKGDEEVKVLTGVNLKVRPVSYTHLTLPTTPYV